MQKRYFLFAFILVCLLGVSPSLTAQTFRFSYLHEQARAPISNLGLENGQGISMSMLFPVGHNLSGMNLVSMEAGMMLDYLSHGSIDNNIWILDGDGIPQFADIENSSMTLGGAVRFSLAYRFPVRPYLGAELAARTQRTYESWDHGDEDCPIENTIERSWAPSIGMNGGVMVKVTPTMNLDLGVMWRQSGPQDIVPLNSIAETEKGSYAYTYDVARGLGQFLGFKIGVSMLLEDDLNCAPYRTTIAD